ncbi:MAG: insulinase family protein [Flavobacteriales bacterium]|nr:insulinase family protein [Flavobacteriales bacterium]
MIRRVVYIWLLCVSSSLVAMAVGNSMPMGDVVMDSLVVENITTMENIGVGEELMEPMDSMVVDSTLVEDVDTILVEKDTTGIRKVGEIIGVVGAIRIDSLKFEPVPLTVNEIEVVHIFDSLPRPTQAPLIHIGTPVKTVLKNGLTVLLYEDHSMPIVSFYMGLNTAGRVFEKEKKGIGELTSRMLLSGVENRTKDQIVDSLAGMGSMYRMTESSFYVSSLSKYTTTSFQLFADVILRPSFPLQEFYAAKNAAIESCRTSEKNERSVLDRVYKALTFAGKSPEGEMMSPSTIEAITPDDCVNYYNTYWRPNNAVLLVMGDITPSQLSTMVGRRFRTWGRAEIPAHSISIAEDVPMTEINFLNVPERRRADVIISNVADFDYNSPDVYPAIFINHIFGGDLLENIRAKLKIVDTRRDEPFSLYPDATGGYMCLRTSVDAEDVVKTIAEKTALLHDVRTSPLSDVELQKMKNYLIGKIALTFEDRAARGAYGVAIENGMVRQGFLEEVLKEINNVTADDIMRVAQKYIKPTQFRIVIQADARSVVPSLELAGYDVKFYNEFAERVSRPSLSFPVGEEVEVKDVMDSYYKAMGGVEKMKSLQTVKYKYKVTIGKRVFEAQSMAKLPFYSQDMLLWDGVVYLKKTFNGNMGYTKVERMRTDLKADVVEKRREDRSIFPLLDYGNEKVKVELDSIVPVRGHYAYKLNVTLSSGRKENHYMSVAEGVPLRIEEVSAFEERVVDKKTGKVTKYTPEKITSCTDFSAYREVDGIKFPFVMEVRDDTGRIVWVLQDVELNAPIPNNDFR